MLGKEMFVNGSELFSASRIYSRQEDISILEYIIQHQAYAHIGGVMLWRQMEENMGNTRTWQSLKEHFLKKVLPNIESYYLSRERVRAFRERKPSRSFTASPCQINGKLYTLKEDKELIKRVLAKVRRLPIGGVLIWKQISSQGSFKNGKRSWQSLKTRFTKYIQPNLRNYTLTEEERNILEQRPIRSESSVTATTKKDQQVSVRTNSANSNEDAAPPVDIKQPQRVTKRKLHYMNNVSASPYVALEVLHYPVVSRALSRDTEQPHRGVNNHAHSNSHEDVSAGSAKYVETTTGVDKNHELPKGPVLKQSIGTQTFISGDLCPGCSRVPDDHQTRNRAVDVPNRDVDLVSVLEGTEFIVPVFKSIIGNRNANVLFNARSASEPTSVERSEISPAMVEDRTNNVHQDVITFERKDKLNNSCLGNDCIPSSSHCDVDRTLQTFSNPPFETILAMNPLIVDNCREQVTFKHTSKKFVASIKEKNVGKKNRIVTRQFVEPSRDSETPENFRPSRVKYNTFRNMLVKNVNCEELLKSRTELELQCSGGRVHHKDLPSSSSNIAKFDLTQNEVLEIQATYNSAQDMEDLSESPTALPESPTPELAIPPPKSTMLPPKSPTSPPESPTPELAIPPPKSPKPPPESPTPPPDSPTPPPESPIALRELPIPPPESPIALPELPIPPPESPILNPESPTPPPESPISPELTTPHFKSLSPDTSGTCSSYELHHLSGSDPDWLDTGDFRDVPAP